MRPIVDLRLAGFHYACTTGRSLRTHMGSERRPAELEGHSMFTTITYLGIAITALSIEIDKYTRFTHPSLPAIAFLGVVMVILSLVL